MSLLVSWEPPFFPFIENVSLNYTLYILKDHGYSLTVKDIEYHNTSYLFATDALETCQNISFILQSVNVAGTGSNSSTITKNIPKGNLKLLYQSHCLIYLINKSFKLLCLYNSPKHYFSRRYMYLRAIYNLFFTVRTVQMQYTTAVNRCKRFDVNLGSSTSGFVLLQFTCNYLTIL